MYDVARLAGVSHQTVSRVLNEHPNVSQSTRQRVLDAIQQLDYRPNQMARGLVTRRSGRIGVISLESRLFGPTSSLLGIEQAAREMGYAVTITVMDAAGTNVDAAAAAMTDQAVEGVIVIAPSEAAAHGIRSLAPVVPVVAAEAGYDLTASVAAVDQAAGARLATEHLLALGHRTVWQIGGPEDWAEARDRVEGWRDALSDAGAAAPPLIRGDWSAASGYEAGLRLGARDDVTAIFAANDEMALGLLNSLHQQGIRVPEDISVVGFDDIPEAAYLIPPLTTVQQDFGAVGRLAVEMLTELISGSDVPPESRRRMIAPTLTVRASTGPARQ